MFKCFLAVLPWLWFYFRPLDREPMGVIMKLPGQLKVFLVKSVMVTGLTGRGCAAVLLPLPPVAVGIVAFNLMGGGSRSPEEAFRETQFLSPTFTGSILTSI
jgi:hypothetical protein